MQHRQRPVAWPLALSLAAHGVLVLLWWRQAPAPVAPTTSPQRAPMVWLRLATAVRPTLPAPVAAERVAAAPARPAPSARPPAKTPALPPAPEPATAAAPPAQPAAPATAAPAVTGVAFGPPRWSLPFSGASAGAVFGTRRPPAATPTPMAVAAVPTEVAHALREQVLHTLEAQVAGWAAPADAQPAQCSLAAGPSEPGNPEPECDSLAMAQALAERLPTLRDALAALRRLTPELPRGAVRAGDNAALVIAFADGRYRLTIASR